MKCKQIRELLVTDFVDDQISDGLRKEVELHLAVCSGCRQFEEAVRGGAVEPFKGIEEVPPPGYLWYRIKDAITAKEAKEKKGSLRGARGLLERILVFPRPAFAFATIAAVILMTVVITRYPVNSKTSVDISLKEQVEFLASLDVNGLDYFDAGSLNLGTSIEEYLL
ncbi:anti-sigma factor family protein [Candidatus Omnitrophota bacterium]